MSYKRNDDELLLENQWDEFASEVLDEFKEKKGRGGCIRVVVLLALVIGLLAGGAYILMNRPAEETASFEETSVEWLEDAQNVIASYTTALSTPQLDCTAVLNDDGYSLDSLPEYDGTDTKFSDVLVLMQNTEKELTDVRWKINSFCGDRATMDNALWPPNVKPDRELTNATNYIQQANALLTAEG